jgi:hypothetical protein
VGQVGNNAVYRVKATEMFPIKDAAAPEADKAGLTSLQGIWWVGGRT